MPPLIVSMSNSNAVIIFPNAIPFPRAGNPERKRIGVSNVKMVILILALVRVAKCSNYSILFICLSSSRSEAKDWS